MRFRSIRSWAGESSGEFYKSHTVRFRMIKLKALRTYLYDRELGRIAERRPGRQCQRCDNPRRALLCSPDPGSQAVHTFVRRHGRDEVGRRVNHYPSNRLVATAKIGNRVADGVYHDRAEFDKVTKRNRRGVRRDAQLNDSRRSDDSSDGRLPTAPDRGQQERKAACTVKSRHY